MKTPLNSAFIVRALMLLLLGSSGCGQAPSHQAGSRFTLELAESAATGIADLGLDVPVKGRAYVVLSTDSAREPRTQTGVRGVPFWGMDVRDLGPGSTVELVPDSPGVLGYPLASFADLPAGEYTVQAFLNVYTTFQRSDGQTLEMHLNSGAGQSQWRAPGNAVSEPVQLTIDPNVRESYRLVIDQVIPPADPVPLGGSLQQGNPADRGDLVRFVKIRSESLSAFWGRDMFIGANVLLPSDYWTNPNRRYPVLYLTGHFPGSRAPFSYSDEEGSGRGRSAGFSEYWRTPESPKFILVSVRDANPFYDTGHSVNSINVGPYGDAFIDELIPHLESEFRMIPEGWARVLAGGSTGGWEALAVQIFNPEDFGGAWGWCPDPVDFHYYQIVNIYEDENAYSWGGEWVKAERPNARRPDGNLVSTIRQENNYERAVGTKGRSGGQWAIWEALFSPVGSDGFAAPIWDRETGAIDPSVAEYWRENWDLTHYLVENWRAVGEDLSGKLHVTVGDMDTYYLNNAVELMEIALGGLDDPPPEVSFEYGRRKPHCWIGSSPWRPGEDLNNGEFLRIVDEYLKKKGRTW